MKEREKMGLKETEAAEMEAVDPFTVAAGGHICLTQANEIGQVKILPVSSHQWHTHKRGCSHTD